MTITELPVPDTDSRPAGDLLAQALNDPDVAVRRAAADALLDEEEVLVGEGGVHAIVRAKERGPDPYTRDVAAELVSAMRAAAWEIYYAALLRDDPSRAEAIRGLTVLKAAAELGDIALTDPDFLIRVRAVRALGGHHDPAAVRPLARALTDEFAAVRLAAARALAARAPGDRLVQEVLADLKDDPDPGVSTEARWALAARR